MRQKLLLLLCSVFVSLATFAAKEDSYLLFEGFENVDSVSAKWTQEFVNGHQEWAIEASSDMLYPTGAFDGSSAIALRNTSGQTQHYVTRLVSPVVDLSDAFQPILVFSHAQAQRTGDVDTLRVYYRSSSNSRWVLLAQYDQKITSWRTDTIELSGASATYQLAFEGTDNFGRGIVLDNVIVRPMPTCDDPSNITTDGLTANSAMLRWNGSLDTDSFLLVLSKSAITDPEQATGVVLQKFVTGFEAELDNLTRNTKYYVYLQAYCGNETSEWVEATFTTKNLASVPYEQSFNMNYASGTVNHVAYWSYGTSIRKDDGTMEYMPFVNQNTTESTRKNFSYNQTTCLVFSGARSTSTVIPAGEYVYAATPEMNVADIKQVMLTFWGTSYDKFGTDYASGLIVGVMTDPADFSTFVAVDTVYAKGEKEYARYDIYFHNYAGNGKYIAFASNFLDKDNLFFLDEVSVKEITAVPVVSNVQISNVSSTSLTVNANPNGAQQLKIVVAKDTTDARTGNIWLTPDSLPASYILAETTIQASALPYTVTNLPGGQFVQVYVEAVSGAVEGGYALPEKVLMPTHWDGNELLIDFEERADDWRIAQLKNFSSAISATFTYPLTMQYELELEPGLSSNSYYYISRYGVGTLSSYNYGHNGKGCIILKSERREFGDGAVWTSKNGGQGIALPEVDTIQNLVLKFYLKCYSTTNPTCSRVRVGVVEDPRDFSTFQEVAVFNGNGDYHSCVASFANYTGNGHYPVILSAPSGVEQSGSSGSGSGRTYKDYVTSYNLIDDITLMGQGGCLPPAAVTVVPSDTTATLTWASNGMSEWIVRLYDKAGARLDSAHVTTTSYVFHNLLPHTTYTFNVVTLCDSVETDKENVNFTTECAPYETVPYFEGFEDFEKYGSALDASSPACWYFPRYRYTSSGGGESSTSYYPYVTTGTTYAHSGNAGIYWYYNSTTTLLTDGFLALPRMNADLNALQLTFWMKANTATYANDTIYVGAMTDPSDYSTFDTVAALRVGSTDYKERIVRFENYTGNGQYIAIRRPRAYAAHFIYLDDFRVDSLSACEKVMDVTARNMSEQGATFTWTSPNASQWEVVLTSKAVELGATVAVGGDILRVDTTNTKPFTISACPQANTEYFVYVRAICGEGNKGDWSQPCAFKTSCVPVTAGAFGTETFSSADAIDCWTVGVREGTVKPSRNTNGYLYMYNTTTTDGAYAIMPMLDIDSIKRLEVSFDAHGGTGAAYLCELTVGVITNPSDLSTFTALKTIHTQRVSAATAATGYGFNEGYRYTVRLDEYEGDYTGEAGKQIMFISESGELANYVYIDNITIDTIAECKAPLELAAVEVGTYDAKLAWEHQGESYQLRVMDGTKLVKDTIVAADSVVVTGLEMLTTYSAQVRTICSAGDTSVWSNARRFTTECPSVYQLPYIETFENYTVLSSAPYSQPSCWNAWYGGALPTTSTTYCRLYASAKYQGTTGYYMGSSTGNATTAPKEAVVVLPAIDQLSTAQISFYAKGSTTTGTRGMAVGISEYADDLDSVLANVVWIDSVTTINGTWAPYTFNLTSYTGNGKHIVLRCFGGNTSATTLSTTALYTYLDDIYVEKVPSCFRPYGLTMEAASATSLEVSWTPGATETAWDVVCVPTGEEIDSTKVVTVTTNPATINGLTASTMYDIYVRANCGDGDVSEWSSALTANTLYQVALADAHWNWEDREGMVVVGNGAATSTYKNYASWIQGNTYYASPKESSTSYTACAYPLTIPTSATAAKYGYQSESALRIYSTATYKTAYAVLPELQANLDTLQVRFMATSTYLNNRSTGALYTNYAKGTYAHAIKVGVLSNPMDFSTLEPLAEFVFPEVTATNISGLENPDAYWNEYIVPLYGVKGKFIVFYSDYAASNYAYIDNVVVEKESGCSLPSKLEATNIAATTASFAWGSSKSQWNVKVELGDSIVAQAVVDSLGWTVENLEGHMDYTFSVQAVCSAEETSEWASLAFSTPCAPFDTARFATDFNKNDIEPYFGNATYKLPGCWTGGQLTMSSATTYTYMPQAIVNTTTYQYGRSLGTEDCALRFYNYSTTYGNSYVILPDMDFELDSVALHFWMRAAYFYTSTYSTTASRNKLYAVNKDYEKKLVIGAIADPSDMTTFVALDTVEYSHSWTANGEVFTTKDETGNDYWEEVTLPLKKYAGKGQLVLFYPYNGKTGYMFVDDLSIVGADFCAAASGLRVSNISAHAASLSWVVAGNDSVQLQVAKNSAEFNEADIVLDVNLKDANGSYELTNLLAGQDYYFRVKHFCSEEEEADWTVSSLFVTDYEVRFVENFTEVRTYPADWTRHSVKVADIFGGAEMSATVTETAVNWTRGPVDADLYVTTGTGTGSTTSTTITTYNYWIISPTIDLSQLTADDNLMLSFDLRLTNNNNQLPFNTPAEDDQFIVAVSTDGGVHFTRQNATVWGFGEDADRSYSEIGAEAKKVFLNMSQYVGNDVRIAFVQNSLTTSGKPSSKNYLHIDNVSLNKYDLTEYAANICRWNDYADANFEIDANELVVGDTTKYEKYTVGAQGDKLVRMYLFVDSDVTNTMEATVCEGESYTLDGFNIVDAKQSATYKQKLEGTNTCDSIVVLNLTVLPRIYTRVEETICQGDFYEFNGVRYYTNTTHADTLQSLVTGCDSIVTLYLTVNEILTGSAEEHLCPGDSVEFGKYGVIKAAGVYVDTLKNAVGCDSVATLTVFLHENAATTVRAAICQGEKYSAGTWAGLNVAGDYPSKQETVYGCDSIVTLHLLVAQDGAALLDSISVSELPYVLNGVELLPEGTPEGTYVKPLSICGGTTITIIVGHPTDLHSVFANTLGVTPNPATVGEPIQVYGGFAGYADVRVMSSVGQLVYSAKTDSEQFTLPGMPVAGTYLVVVASDGNIRQAKLIVK